MATALELNARYGHTEAWSMPVSGDNLTTDGYRPMAGVEGSLWHAADTALADGTYHVSGGQPVRSLFSFGYYVNTAEIAAPVGTEWSQYEGQLIGVWTDPATGKVWTDLSSWVPVLSDAMRHGMENHQLAIWDILNHESISLPVHQ